MQHPAVRQDTDHFRSLVVGLLPIAAFIVTSTIDRPLSWAMWLPATAVAHSILCVFLGLVLMISGFGVMLIDRESEAGKWLVGIGACAGMDSFAVGSVLVVGYTLLQLVRAIAGG